MTGRPSRCCVHHVGTVVRAAGAITIACAGLIHTSCAGPPLPTYPGLDTDTAVTVLTEHAAAPASLRASGVVTLAGADGDSITLDAALAARGSDRIRLRAWKFGHAAFDITLNADGLWVMAGERAGANPGEPLPDLTARRFTSAWDLLAGGFFRAPARLVEEAPGRIVLERDMSGTLVRATADRPTLTVRTYEVFDGQGTVAARLTLSHYRMSGDRAWPMHSEATGPQGTITVDLDDVEFDAALPESIFVAPPRAVRQP